MESRRPSIARFSLHDGCHAPIFPDVGIEPPCRLLALLGHAGAVGRCPLFGIDRKWRFGAVRTVFDPSQTWVDDGRMSAVGAKVITPARVASQRKAEGEQHGSARIRWTAPLPGSPA